MKPVDTHRKWPRRLKWAVLVLAAIVAAIVATLFLFPASGTLRVAQRGARVLREPGTEHWRERQVGILSGFMRYWDWRRAWTTANEPDKPPPPREFGERKGVFGLARRQLTPRDIFWFHPALDHALAELQEIAPEEGELQAQRDIKAICPDWKWELSDVESAIDAYWRNPCRWPARPWSPGPYEYSSVRASFSVWETLRLLAVPAIVLAAAVVLSVWALIRRRRRLRYSAAADNKAP